MVTLLLHRLRLLHFSAAAIASRPREPGLAPPGGGRHPGPSFPATDRLFWVGLARAWTGWPQSLVIVTPATVQRWQRRGFREHWTQLSGRPTGARPPVNIEITALARKMTAANPLWAALESTASSLSSVSTWPSARFCSPALWKRGASPAERREIIVV